MKRGNVPRIDSPKPGGETLCFNCLLPDCYQSNKYCLLKIWNNSEYTDPLKLVEDAKAKMERENSEEIKSYSEAYAKRLATIERVKARRMEILAEREAERAKRREAKRMALKKHRAKKRAITK